MKRLVLLLLCSIAIPLSYADAQSLPLFLDPYQESEDYDYVSDSIEAYSNDNNDSVDYVAEWVDDYANGNSNYGNTNTNYFGTGNYHGFAATNERIRQDNWDSYRRREGF